MWHTLKNDEVKFNMIKWKDCKNWLINFWQSLYNATKNPIFPTILKSLKLIVSIKLALVKTDNYCYLQISLHSNYMLAFKKINIMPKPIYIVWFFIWGFSCNYKHIKYNINSPKGVS